MTDAGVSGDAPLDADPIQPTVKTTRRVLKRLVSDPVSAAALAFLVFVVLAAILAPWLAPYEPTQLTGAPAQSPSWEHLAGTDEVGRDILSRIIYGARVSLAVGLIAPVIALLVGVPWGLASGYFGGLVDTISMRVMDGLLAFPALILAMATVAVLGPNLRNVMLAIGIVYIPRFARLARAEVLRVKQQEYVSASLASGASDIFIMRRTVFPNIVPIITVQFTLNFATAVLAEAGLSFLGLGAQPPTPSWGGMLSVARNYLDLAPLYSVFVGSAIFLTVLSMSLVGDALRDVIDPRRRL